MIGCEPSLGRVAEPPDHVAAWKDDRERFLNPTTSAATLPCACGLASSWLARAAEAAGTVEHVRRGRGGIAQPVPRGTPNHLWRWYLISTSASPPDCRCLDAPRPKPVRAARSVRAPRTPGRGARSFAETWIASDRAGSSGKPVRNTTASPMNPCCARQAKSHRDGPHALLTRPTPRSSNPAAGRQDLAPPASRAYRPRPELRAASGALQRRERH